jgi:hypothetical protein
MLEWVKCLGGFCELIDINQDRGVSSLRVVGGFCLTCEHLRAVPRSIRERGKRKPTDHAQTHLDMFFGLANRAKRNMLTS